MEETLLFQELSQEETYVKIWELSAISHYAQPEPAVIGNI
jgi:hypothetical protein